MLKLQFKDQRKPAIWLVDSRYAIGSDTASDIKLDGSSVSGFHAELRVESDDRIFVTDAGSKEGTWVNGKQISGRTQLRAGDIIRIEDVELELVDPKAQTQQVDDAAATAIAPALKIPGEENKAAASDPGWRLVARTGTLVGKSYKIPASGRVVMGRSQSSDIVLPSNHVSRQHAELIYISNKLHVRDLGSSNGTYVNRKKVTETALKPGDEIRLDTLVFRVEAPGYQEEEKSGAPAASDTEKTSARSRPAAPADTPAPAARPAAQPTAAARSAEPAPSSPASEPEAGSSGGGMAWVLVLVVGAGIAAAAAWWFLQGS